MKIFFKRYVNKKQETGAGLEPATLRSALARIQRCNRLSQELAQTSFLWSILALAYSLLPIDQVLVGIRSTLC